MAQVTFTFDTETESHKIQVVNEVLLGSAKVAPAKSEAPKETPKETTNPATENTKSSAESSSSSKVTFDEFKAAAKAAKSDHGEEFAMEVLVAAGTEKQTTLLKTVQAADKELYADIVEAWSEGPQTKQASDEPEDDWDEDDSDEEEAEVTVEAVKLALKAYAKEKGRDEAKEIMTKNGASALSKVDECSPKQLAAMMKELV